MNRLELKKARFTRRKFQIKKKIFGSEDRLRLSVFRSAKHIIAQIINDNEGITLVSASTHDKEIIGQIKPEMKKVDKSKLVGNLLAKRASEKNIKKVAFDRNGFLYHGRVKALADAAREAGLEF
jgi:large subunit ribosomal protein L18